MKADAPVILLWGESPFLLREAAKRLLGEGPVTEVEGASWQPGMTSDIATPSLFGESRRMLLTGLQDVDKAGLDELAAYALEPNPDARLVMTAVVSARAKGPPVKLTKQLQGRAEIERVAVERRDLPDWVRKRAQARGVPATAEGARALVDTIGEDPALLDQAVVQISGAFAEEGLTPKTVAAQFRGFGDRKVWDLCDAAFAGDGPAALRHLTGMLEAREAGLAILGGIASRLRDLIKVAAVPGGTPPGQVARAAGLRFDWQAKKYQQQARRYSEERLAALHARLLECDRMLKVGARDDVVLPMVVAAIAAGG